MTRTTRRLGTTPRSSLLALLWCGIGCLLTLRCPAVQAIPQFVMKNGGNKCLKVDVTADMVLIVDYEAPDLKLTGDERDAESRRRASMTGSDANVDDDRDDDRSRREPYERSRPNKPRKSRMPDMMIQMNHLMEDGGRRRSAGANRKGTRKLRHDVVDRTGQLIFYTGERDGFVEICVQAYMATAKEPRRMGLRVDVKSTLEFKKDEAVKAGRPVEEIPGVIQHDQFVNVETSRISKELERHVQRIQDIAGNMAASKDRQASFHESSVSLSRGVRRYPIFRICILLVAGYMQASHVVRYMRSRHIY